MPLRILLADENPAVQKLLEMTLQQEDMELTITDNGLSALDIAIKQHPDLILADFNMAGLEIKSFIQKAKNREDIAGIPIILLVHADETHDPIYLQSLGVEAFIKKPIDTQALKEQINALSLLGEPPTAELSEAPGLSELSQHFTSSDDDSKMIADLLGWSTPEENQAADEIEADCEEDSSDFSEPETPPEQVDSIQIEPAHKKSDAPSLEESKEEPEDFSFDSGNLFPEDEQRQADEASQTTLEEAASDIDENDLLQPPAYGEPIIVPRQADDHLSADQEPEMASSSFPFDENDPFAQTETVDFEEDGIAEPALPEVSSGSTEQSQPFEKIVDNTIQEASSEPSFLPEVANQAFSQTHAEEEDDLGLGDELVKKTVQAVQETAERIVQEMLPELVKTALSREMISPIVEGVAWELIPALAEAEIKKELKRLQPEQTDS